MATEKAPTASETLKNLEQQLTCPVCLDRYTQPRTLPCLHSFCHNCLAHFPVQVQGGQALYDLPRVPPDHTATRQGSEWIPVCLPHQQPPGAPSSAREGVWVPAE